MIPSSLHGDVPPLRETPPEEEVSAAGQEERQHGPVGQEHQQFGRLRSLFSFLFLEFALLRQGERKLLEEEGEEVEEEGNGEVFGGQR